MDEVDRANDHIEKELETRRKNVAENALNLPKGHCLWCGNSPKQDESFHIEQSFCKDDSCSKDWQRRRDLDGKAGKSLRIDYSIGD